MKCRKLLAILLALVMVIGLLPFNRYTYSDPPVPQAGGHHDGWTALNASTSSWKMEATTWLKTWIWVSSR